MKILYFSLSRVNRVEYWSTIIMNSPKAKIDPYKYEYTFALVSAP